MCSLKAWTGLVAMLVGCVGTDTGNPVNDQPRFEIIGENKLLILDANVSNCSGPRAPDASKLAPAEAELVARLGTESSEFVVVMKREVSLEDYPLPADRTNIGEDNPLYRARASEVARSQGCTLETLAADGGRYVHSFLLINAFVADLTVEQAVAISELPDVRTVQLAQSDEPPPDG